MSRTVREIAISRSKNRDDAAWESLVKFIKRIARESNSTQLVSVHWRIYLHVMNFFFWFSRIPITMRVYLNLRLLLSIEPRLLNLFLRMHVDTLRFTIRLVRYSIDDRFPSPPPQPWLVYSLNSSNRSSQPNFKLFRGVLVSEKRHLEETSFSRRQVFFEYRVMLFELL